MYKKALLNNYKDITEDEGVVKLQGYQVLVLEI